MNTENKTESWSIQIPVAPLLAVSKFAEQNHEDGRILNGVRIEIQKDAVLIVATNGRIMAFYRELSLDGNPTAPPVGKSVVIPGRLIRDLPHLSDGRTCEDIAISVNGPVVRLTSEDQRSWSDRIPSGKFPDWRKVFKPGNAVDRKVTCINPAYMGVVADAAEILVPDGWGCRLSSYLSEGSDADYPPILVSLNYCPNFLAIIMPMMPPGSLRNLEAVEIPEWLK